MYTLLSVPKDIQIFFPMAALLGALLGLGMLAQRSELVVMQASGFTRMQVALSVMKTAIPLVLLTMAIGEWVAPQGEQMARNYRAQAMYGGSLLSTQQGLWAKDGNNFVYIERVKGDEELAALVFTLSTISVVCSRCVTPLRQNSIRSIRSGVCRRWMSPICKTRNRSPVRRR